MHNYDLILTLTGGLSAALILGYVTHRLGLSPIVGYLLAGILVGPHTPGFVADSALAEQFAEIGVILLMFGVGLTFHIEELLAVRRIAIPGALAQSTVATLLGALLVHALGWGWSAGVLFGLALSVASTVVLVRVLSDNRELHTAAGRVAVGWLVVEDLLTVIALVLLPVIFGSAGDAPVWLTLGGLLLKVMALVAFTVFVGSRLIPRALDYISRTRSRELFTLAVLVLALGIAVGAAQLFSVSMALGAFLAGMIVGRSEYSLRAASDALPMRDAFAVLFFVSVGMLVDPRRLMDEPMLTAGALLIVLVAKPAIALLILWLVRFPAHVSFAVAMSLAQIGEFSFILATMGRDLGLLTPAATNALVAASIVSIVLNPLLYRASGLMAARFPRWGRSTNEQSSAAQAPAPTSDARHRAVVVGCGPTGRTVVRLLEENGIEPTVIDLNVETVRSLRQAGLKAIYGDATHPDTLIAAGVPAAASLVLTSAGMDNSADVIRTARELNPGVKVLARGGYLNDLAGLRQAGANTSYSGEGEVALAFVEDILRGLGATAEQIERERLRAHAELFGEK